MTETIVLVASLSESFSDVWGQLGTGLDTEVRVVSAAEAGTISPATAAVLLAAGGAEREAAEGLRRAPPPGRAAGGSGVARAAPRAGRDAGVRRGIRPWAPHRRAGRLAGRQRLLRPSRGHRDP